MKFEFPSFTDLPSSPIPYFAGEVFANLPAYGTLNHLTAECVADAALQIQTGDRVSLDWKLGYPKYPYFSRKRFKQEIKTVRTMADETLNFDTRTSSHWDWGSINFNLVPSSPSPPTSPRTPSLAPGRNTPPTSQIMQAAPDSREITTKGIVGRGVLVDFARYIHLIGVEGYSALSSCPINLEFLKHVIDAEAVTIQPGDILIIRTGHAGEYERLPMQAQKDLVFHEANVVDRYCGLLQEEDILRYIWDNQIAAVATDSPSIEVIPPRPAGEGTEGLNLKQCLLTGLMCPVGELWDLEALSEACERHERWSFFFTSAPLRVEGGLASTPNALAIF